MRRASDVVDVLNVAARCAAESATGNIGVVAEVACLPRKSENSLRQTHPIGLSAT